MIFKTARISCFLIATAMLVPLANPAHAKIYVPNLVTVSLQRQPDNSGEAYIRLSTPVALTGCPQVSPLNHTSEIEEPLIVVELQDYNVDFDALNETPKPVCHGNMQFATADVPLDRDVISDNHITAVNLTLQDGQASDRYTITMDKNHIELLPQTSKVFKPASMPVGGQAALMLWYYPENTLIITAPVAPSAQQDQAIADYAASMGLTPLEKVMPEFVMPAGQGNRHYYVDKDKRLMDKVPSHDDVAVSDMIYARRPGTHD